MSQDWCDLCELPKSQCPHGAPPPPPAAPAAPAAPARVTSSGSRRPSTRVIRTTSRTPGAAAEAPVARRAPRTPPGRTPQADFRPHLLAVLADYPVAVERDAVLAELEQRMTLTSQDRGITADGEVRWRRTALKERKAMADDGLVDSAGHALWVLTRAGREEAELSADTAGDTAGDTGEDTPPADD